MEFPRLPRFRRSNDIRRFALTERDHQIIRLIYRHRFLRSSHISSLVPGSSQQILRRLQLLYHHRFLARPRSQIEHHIAPGSREIVYGLGNEGAKLLKLELGEMFREVPWDEDYSSVKRVFLEHALLVSDILVSLEIACRQNGIRLLTEQDLAKANRPFRWSIHLTGRKFSVAPDRVFALEWSGQDGTARRSYFFLEADRGTMPVVRKSLSQTSFYRKLLAYEATWRQAVHEKLFGFNRFRVLTVTTSAARVKSIIDACSKLESGHGLFLFTDISMLHKPQELLSHIWQSAKPGQAGTLLD